MTSTISEGKILPDVKPEERDWTTVESTLSALAYMCHREVVAKEHTDPILAAVWDQTRRWLLDLRHDGWLPGCLDIRPEGS